MAPMISTAPARPIRSARPLPPARSVRPRSLFAIAFGALGLSAVVAGAALPWVVLFAGLWPLPGFLLEGGPLTALAVAGLALPAVAARVGGAHVLRPLAVAVGAFVAAAAVAAGIRIDAYVADPGPAGPLSQPSAGPGAWLTALGGALVAASALLAPVPPRRMSRTGGIRLALAALLYVAGVIHLLLTPEHLGEATLLGLGFLAAAVAQLALAAIVILRADDLVLSATVAVTVALLGLYVYAVLVGLPFGGAEEEHAVGIVVGAGEPVDWWGFVDLLAEVGAVGLAWLLSRGIARSVAPAVAGEGSQTAAA